MDNIGNWLQANLGIDPLTQYKLLLSLLLIATLWVIHRFLLNTIVKRLRRTKARYQWSKALRYSFSTIGLLSIGLLWLENAQYAATYLGLLSAGVAIALKDPIMNFFGWGYILLRHPFEVGDRIQVGEHAGDVVDQGILLFSMMEIGNWVHADQSTGRVLHIPNALVFTSPIANFTKGSDYIWNEIEVRITFESDWQQARSIMQSIADKHFGDQREKIEKSFQDASQEFLLKYSELNPMVYTSVVENGVMLTIRHLCNPRRRRGVTHAIWEDILQAFAQHPDINLAYPTTRFYSSEQQRGKNG